jgi:hypothetical protein
VSRIVVQEGTYITSKPRTNKPQITLISCNREITVYLDDRGDGPRSYFPGTWRIVIVVHGTQPSNNDQQEE